MDNEGATHLSRLEIIAEGLAHQTLVPLYPLTSPERPTEYPNSARQRQARRYSHQAHSDEHDLSLEDTSYGWRRLERLG